MNLAVFIRIFGFAASFCIIAFGVIFLTAAFNLFNVQYLPKNFRVMFGIVFILYGIYRIARLVTVKKDMDEEGDS
jgi:hypothetical protein